MFDLVPAPLVLLLHGITGGWDELIVLAAGIALAVFVVKWTNRSAGQAQSADDPLSVGDGPTEHRSDPS